MPEPVSRADKRRCYMNPDDFPSPKRRFVITHVLVVSDQDRSREFYRSLFDGQVLLERDPVIMKVANTWLILNVGGGPTDDKPTVTLTTPADPSRTSAFLNVRVANINKVYKEWAAKGAEFLTEPKDHGREIRAYMLLAVAPTPVVALNRAIAIGEVEGPAAALALVDELDLDNYHPFHATRADLLRRLGRKSEAAAAYERAAAMAPTDAERAFLRLGGRASHQAQR